MADDERAYPDPTSGIFVSHLYRYVWSLPYVFDKVVLDAGCGSGYGAELLATIAKRVAAVDYDPDVIARNRSVYASRSNLTFDVMDVSQLAFATGAFDVIVSLEVFEHLESSRSEAYLRELHRVCHDGGTVILSTPNRLVEKPHLKSAGVVYHYHVNSVSPAELKRAASKHFSRVEIYGQRPVERPVKRVLKWLDVFNLRHHLLAYGTKNQLDVMLSGGVRSWGPDLRRLEIGRSLRRQSSTIVAVCTK